MSAHCLVIATETTKVEVLEKVLTVFGELVTAYSSRLNLCENDSRLLQIFLHCFTDYYPNLSSEFSQSFCVSYSTAMHSAHSYRTSNINKFNMTFSDASILTQWLKWENEKDFCFYCQTVCVCATPRRNEENIVSLFVVLAKNFLPRLEFHPDFGSQPRLPGSNVYLYNLLRTFWCI